jgi:t-SNARE complex subunit (syntaxin)
LQPNGHLQLASSPQSRRLDLAEESLRYAQMRHKDLRHLEKSLQEVQQLFVDMAAMVDRQGDVLDRVAFRVCFSLPFLFSFLLLFFFF